MLNKLNVLLLQLPVPNNPGLNTPLAAGYLKAYAYAQGLSEVVAIELLERRIADQAGDALLVEEIVARRPDVLGISLYTWNSERSLAIAGLVRQRLPGLRVLVGGPEVQTDNAWVLEHPAVDVAVLGEGEQTFVELLRLWSNIQPVHDLAIPLASHASVLAPHSFQEAYASPDLPHADHPTQSRVASSNPLAQIAGLAYHDGGELRFTGERTALSDLSVIPSPYLLGYLEVPANGMLMVEVSRWCPYACSFCLYGRSMGPRLGNRYFGLERVLEEIRWGYERGITRIHFVEANLNLVPIFKPLMSALKQLNHDRSLKLYAELRGEHLSDEAVEALVGAGLHAAEVGLQSANPRALQAVARRTDLARWAAGARRLYQREVEVYLDVILGLPADDRASVLETLAWIEREQLGAYDIFTLQLLPGTQVRAEAQRWGIRHQQRPPYYVLENESISYAELRALRWELRERMGLDPQSVEGMPEPRFEGRPLGLRPPRALERLAPASARTDEGGAQERERAAPIALLALNCRAKRDWAAEGERLSARVASALTLVVHHADQQVIQQLCWPIARANPSIHWDVVLLSPLAPAQLRALQRDWPHQIGYLDRIAVYRQVAPEPGYSQVTPRFFIVAQRAQLLDPLAYEGLAEVLWLVDDEIPLEVGLELSIRRGGSGVVLSSTHYQQGEQTWREWRDQTGWRVWQATELQNVI